MSSDDRTGDLTILDHPADTLFDDEANFDIQELLEEKSFPNCSFHEFRDRCLDYGLSEKQAEYISHVTFNEDATLYVKLMAQIIAVKGGPNLEAIELDEDEIHSEIMQMTYKGLLMFSDCRGYLQ